MEETCHIKVEVSGQWTRVLCCERACGSTRASSCPSWLSRPKGRAALSSHAKQCRCFRCVPTTPEPTQRTVVLTLYSAANTTYECTGMMKGVSVPNRNCPASTKTMSPAVSSLAVVGSGSDPHDPSPAAAAVAPSAAEELVVLPLPVGKSLLSPPEQPQSAPAVPSSAFVSPSGI